MDRFRTNVPLGHINLVKLRHIVKDFAPHWFRCAIYPKDLFCQRLTQFTSSPQTVNFFLTFDWRFYLFFLSLYLRISFLKVIPFLCVLSCHQRVFIVVINVINAIVDIGVFFSSSFILSLTRRLLTVLTPSLFCQGDKISHEREKTDAQLYNCKWLHENIRSINALNLLHFFFSGRESQEKQKMSKNGETLLIDIVNGPSVGYCCNLKGKAPDVLTLPWRCQLW